VAEQASVVHLSRSTDAVIARTFVWVVQGSRVLRLARGEADKLAEALKPKEGQ
jgi:hypothetical protein